MTSKSERLARLSPQKLALLKKTMGESAVAQEPIAVVGMGCRFAGATDVGEYWRLIRDRVDRTGEIPATRWDVDEFFDPSGKTPGKMTTRWGGFLDNIDHFDAGFFGISPREAEKMDPQHRLLLEVTWHALEYGGIAPSDLRGSSTGVFVGVGGVDYSRIPLQLDNYYEQITAYSGTGNALSIAANRISYALDLRGPSLAIDTACSSSLVATHLAIRSLRGNECQVAIVGGVNAILTPETTLAFSQAQMLSPDGKCRPFDSKANGYVRGEGCGVVVLKRLTDAVRQGDHVLATIRGSAINQDGMTSGITAPRGTAQVDVIRKALRDARCTPDEVSYVEAHGTATPLGDPIEINALAEVFRTRDSETGNAGHGNGKQHDLKNPPCYFGSVKANIGHTETAAGMASLIKTILMLGNRMIPAQTHFQKLNPHIDLSNSRLQVAAESMEWESGGKTPIAGVSSFGFGGANAHLVLEASSCVPAERIEPERPQHVLTISAKTPERLRQVALDYSQSMFEKEGNPLADLCFSAAVGRSHFNHRLAIPCRDLERLREALVAFSEGREHATVRSGKARADRSFKVAFLFPGQGAQYPAMGRQLFQTHPVFREALEQCDDILAEHLPARLLEVLFEDSSDQPLIHQTLYTQPILFAIEYGLSRLWRSFGLEPAVMIGHSVGDYVAACEAGVFSVEDGLRLVAHRARLVQSLPRDGSMAVIFAEREQVADFVMPYADEVSIAAHNGTQNVVISGHDKAVCHLLEQFELAGVQSRKLEVSHAMHSPMLDPILDEFEQYAGEVEYDSPKVPLISSRDGGLLDARIKQPAYWRDHLRGTVCFVDGVKTLADFSMDAAIEMGPGSTLCGLASRLWQGSEISWLPSLRARQDDWEVLASALAELYVQGANIDWHAFDRPWKRQRVILPTYPFEPHSHWYDMSRRLSHPAPPRVALHPLLGNRLPLAGDKSILEQVLDAEHPEFLRDHQVDQNPVMPAAAYMEQALSAANLFFGSGSHALGSLSIQQAMVLPQGQRRVVQVQIGSDHRGERTFEVHSRSLEADQEASLTWILHASGTLHRQDPDDAREQRFDLGNLQSRMSRSIDGNTFYQRMAGCGLNYGPSFQVIQRLQSGSGECCAQLELPETMQHEISEYTLHPAILDGCLQSIAGVLVDPESDATADLFLPTHADQVRVFRPIDGETLWTHTRLRNAQPETGTYDADIELFNAGGDPIAKISGARVQRVSNQRSTRAKRETDWLYQIHWEKDKSEGPSAKESMALPGWILFAGNQAWGNTLAEPFASLGEDVVIVRPGSEFAQIAVEDAKSPRCFEMDPSRSAHYEALFDALGENGSKTYRVLDGRALALRSTSGRFPDSEDIANSRTFDSEPDAAKTICSQALNLLQTLAKSRAVKIELTVLLTQGANAVSESDQVSPAQTALWGMGRTALVELNDLSIQLIDLDPDASPQAAATSLFNELKHHPAQANSAGGIEEDHIARRGDDRYVGRLQSMPELLKSSEKGSERNTPASGRFSLRADVSGGVDGLHYVPIAEKPLGPNEVELEVKSTGLNFSDVLKAIGLYPGVQDEIVPLGIECAGVVSRVGEEVNRFRPGQRVMGVAPYSFASHAISADYALVATPDNLSDEQAATIPITFLTAYHALCKLARLSKGEKVLIHAGAGGVGQAAIQIAQSIGADIFATAGSEAKRDFLRSLGVEHVFDSRSLEFADQILEITSGEGVDVVLNSLPGEAITKSLSLLSSYGRFLEIGKTDIYQNRRIGLWPFQDNLSYFAIDLDRMLRQRPDEIRQLYVELMPCFEEGTYRSLPLKTFPKTQVVDAFRYMAQRKNIGKVVVSLASQEREVEPSTNAGELIRDSSTVLITGGLGALGHQVAQWAIDRGVRHIALLTRQDPSAVEKPFSDLRSEQTSLAIIQGDVCDLQSLENALASLPAEFPPVRGVIHAAGLLADGLMRSMDLDQLTKAMAPKTQGAWNLHRVLDDSLDFFVCFSSIAGTIGSPGQANYAAGNAFLDGLARLRREQGLPALSIAWGPWDSDGMAADSEIRRQLRERGMNQLPPELAIGILDAALQTEATNFAVMDVDWDKLLKKLPGRGSSILKNYRVDEASTARDTTQRSRNEELCKRLESASHETRRDELKQIIADALGDVMGIDADSIEADQPLATLGLDSLMGMELRSNLESKLGIEIPVASLFDDPTVLSLAIISADLIGGQQDRDADSSRQPEDTQPKVADQPLRRGDLVSLGGTDGEKEPIFCLHPVGGDLRCYHEFARAIQGRSVYGLRAHGLQPGSEIHQSMDEMVGDYINTIRAAQPDGPYCLMGWSTGGIFAYEIARRLRHQGLVVKPLVMVDTPLPEVFERIDLGDDARFLVDLVEFANYFAGTKMEIVYESLHQQNEQEATAHVLELAIKHGVLPINTTHDFLQRLINVCKQHVQILQNYVAPASDLSAHLLRPEDKAVLTEATRQTHSDDFGWGGLVTLKSYRVPGHHFTMMTGDNAVEIAERIDSLFQQDAIADPGETATSRVLPERPPEGVRQ